ncbi:MULTISPECIES: MFS transporter [unclassified Cupriavidus]|jgi:MFS family permease|uniref:MFS transporter n=1 Tax=unclassified Cupriavidus TaxID=2640874 RepID=UPI001BFFF664|nr:MULTISPECIES: MFS transporter [unclassified Cupriavidus]MCA3194559.1 MFS transporter [Cupriavidus sp.]MCA3200144.1 MFS transporter [Cupriavidus sp.]MCA3204190.1 MFS transporter [Cupriavidus sp.]MCA3209326.1 MFS transporter [Cupriavidus sp.]QWE97532.1 MFS transporter [Cupriavidus sp. EM10]
MTQAAATSTTKPSGTFAPLAQPTFAVLWVATILGNIGSFMRDVASAWLATDLSSSPAAVATIQAAATLPVFLLAIPAGVLSDILDRRRFLIVIQIALAAVSGTLAFLSWQNGLTIEILIALAFAGGIGAAMMGPTWQSIVPELVPQNTLRQAVALNGLGVNIARAIGPAMGGLLLAAFGAAATYGADLVSYVFVIGALIWWKRPVQPSDPLREHFFSAFRAGLRFTRAHSKLHIVLLRAAVHFAFGSSVWALLPLVAKQLLHGGAGLYGVLLGAVGAGAILGALSMPTLQKRLDGDGVILASAIATAVVMAGLSFAPPVWLALPLLLVLGAAWILALTTLGGAAQAILPNWVRGRALAVYQMVFNGALAGGSLLWGFVAQAMGTPHALLIAAVGLVVAALLLHRIRLPRGEEDLGPARHWPEPEMADDIAHDRGPVMILIEYCIPAANRDAFLRAVHRLSEERLRDGAFNWGVMEDPANPELLTEWFLVESWAEHLRQHRRVPNADADLQRDVAGFHVASEPPRVRHLLGVGLPDATR